MKNYIRNIVLLVVVIVGIFLIFKSKIGLEKTQTDAEQSVSSTTNTTLGNAQIASFNTPDKAWATLEKYLEYAHTHNIEGVKSIAYKFTGTCSKVAEDPGMKDKCYKVLDDFYSFGITLKKSDFSNVAFDNKQVIFSTPIIEKDNGDKIETSKNLIYFLVNGNGEIKLLGLEMGRSFSVEKTGLSKEELAAKVLEKTKDSDDDGIEDRGEVCGSGTVESCKKTDPFKKDTDEDGFWDGIEPLLLQL